MSFTLEQFGIDRLDARQRIELIQLIWDTIPPEQPHPVTDEWARELDRRLAAADANPTASQPWESVKARILHQP